MTTPAPAGLSPGQLLAQANDLLCQDMPPGTFAACLFGLLDPASGEFRFANAGHCLPLVLRAQGGVVELRATGMPLGLMPDQEYEDQAAVLAPGDCLVLYSDGLVEAHDPAGGMYGIPRLHQVLAGQGGALTSAAQRSDSLIRALLERLDGFTGPEWEQEDDVTLVTVERSRE